MLIEPKANITTNNNHINQNNHQAIQSQTIIKQLIIPTRQPHSQTVSNRNQIVNPK